MFLADPKSRKETLIQTGLAILLACIVLLPLLGHKLLADWDEAIYAEISREMLQRGWLAPSWNYHPWLEKPPLMFWITAAFFKVFGVHEFWARAGSAFSGVAITGLLHGWLARCRDSLAAWLSTIILLSTFGFLHVCRVGEMDVLLSLGCCIALCGIAAVQQRRLNGWYLFWGGFAVALMTKGAASVVLVITLFLIAVTERWRADRTGAQCWFGLLGFLAAVMPWHLAMWYRFGHRFIEEYLGFHTLVRATHQIEGHTTHGWYYLWVILISAPPYALLYPMAVVAGLRRVELRVWAVFALVVLGFFTAVQTRLPHYIAPAYPALSLLTAVFLADRLRRFAEKRKQSSMALYAKPVVVGIVVWGFAAWVTTKARQNLHSEWVGGKITHEEKESLLLLRDVFAHPQTIPGPLLVWREGDTRSITASIFYSRRQVQQIQLEPLPAGAVTYRYYFQPETFGEAVTSKPGIILLDKKLLQRIPPGFRYTRLISGPSMEVGVIQRTE